MIAKFGNLKNEIKLKSAKERPPTSLRTQRSQRVKNPREED